MFAVFTIGTDTYTANKQITVKGEVSPQIKCGYYDRATPEKFLVYHSPMFETWKVPKSPAEVLCDVTQHLLAYRTAVGNRTNSSGMRTHTGQHSRLPCMHALNFS